MRHTCRMAAHHAAMVPRPTAYSMGGRAYLMGPIQPSVCGYRPLARNNQNDDVLRANAPLGAENDVAVE